MRVTDVNRNVKNVNRISYVYNKLSKDDSLEGKEAFKSYKNMMMIVTVTLIIIMVLFGFSFSYGISYYEKYIPDNTEPIKCYSDSDGKFHTSHESLKGMSLNDVGMDRKDYDGGIFYVFVDKDTDQFVSSMTKEENDKAVILGENIMMYSLIGFVVCILLDIVIINFTVGRKSRNYIKKHNI